MQISDAELKELKRLLTANRGLFRQRAQKSAELFFEEMLHQTNLAAIATEAQRVAEGKVAELQRECERLTKERDDALAARAR